jgi:hypothetical protein
MSSTPPSNAGRNEPPPAKSGCRYPSERKAFAIYLIQGVVVAALLSVVASVVASYIWARKYERRFTTVTIPVFIRGQDAQGGQFALGVVRAMDHALRHGVADVDGRRVEPLFLDEDLAFRPDGLNQLVDRIKNLKPPVPIVVGPLTSSASALLVPRIAGELKIPMILGIPTSMSATNKANGYAWRLSPKNDKQAEVVAQFYFNERKADDHLLVIQDQTDNPDYSADLVALLMPALNEVGRRSPEKIMIETRGEYAEIDRRFASNQQRPLSIIYVGMPEVARDLVAKADRAHVDALWIFTDGCITDKGLINAATQTKSSQFFVTFQGPPAIDSPGLLRYNWYVRNTGGHVSFAVENSRCDEDSSASSYEIFGFDSYLLAINVLKDTVAGGELSAAAANKTLGSKKIEDPFLLLGPYNFANGDSQNLTFHMYRIADNCLSRWPPKNNEAATTTQQHVSHPLPTQPSTTSQK